MSYFYETERLLLRKFEKADAAFVSALLNTPGWLQFIGDRNIRTIEDAEAYIQTLENHHHTHGFGPMLVCSKEGLTPMGMCSLIKRDHLKSVDIGFAFMPEYIGRGYAFEASRGTYLFAKQHLNLDKLCAITNTDNLPSIKLLEKLGFRYVEKILLEGEDEPVLLFEDQN